MLIFTLIKRRGIAHNIFVALYYRFFPPTFLCSPRRRWEDNIKMDFQEVGRVCGDWMGLAQYRDRWRALVSTVMNFRVVP